MKIDELTEGFGITDLMEERLFRAAFRRI